MARHTQATLPGTDRGVAKTNLYESTPGTPAEDYIDRDELVRRLGRLCDDVLPMLAARGGYPVAYDHCFRRIAYDVACGCEWTETIDRPFVEHAPAAELERAYRVAAWMARGGPATVRSCNDASLEHRGVDG